MIKEHMKLIIKINIIKIIMKMEIIKDSKKQIIKKKILIEEEENLFQIILKLALLNKCVK